MGRHELADAQWNKIRHLIPMNVANGSVKIGDRVIEGNDKACLLVRPHPNSDTALVAAISGTGIVGMKLCDRLPYFVSGVGYADLMVFGLNTLDIGSEGVEVVGFFGMDWSVETGEFVYKETPKSE